MSTTIVAADQPTPRRQFTGPGSSIAHQAGAVRIVLTCWPTHFSINCYVAADRLAAWCATYTSEQVARDEARRIAHIFARHTNPDRLDAYIVNSLRPAMVAAIADGASSRLAALRAELAALAPLAYDTRAA